MKPEIKIICLPLPLRMGSVNCYLIETEAGYLLIDTGASSSRLQLAREIDEAGCEPGRLKLILLTHGDFDHSGNAAYLRIGFGGKIAMHHDDLEMVERGEARDCLPWPRQAIPVGAYQNNEKRLIHRLAGVNFFSPGVDAALQVLHLAEAGADQQLEGTGRAGAGFAEDDHLLGAVQLGEAGGKLAQRDQRGAFDTRDLQLVRLAHIQQAQVVACLQAQRRAPGR